jgi:glycosyltransferase involved in cell wall biosynthesis
VLTGAPEASLILRCNDMAPGANVERLIARFGRALAARIDIVEAATPEDFYTDVDVALLPRKGSSPRAAAEAIACGVPAVALGGAAPGEPYGDLLRVCGLGGCLVAADERDYVSIALGLATSGVARERVAAAVARAAEAGRISARVAASELVAELRARLAAGTAS